MKKKVTSSKVPATARFGFGRAKPRAADEAAAAKAQPAPEPAPTIFRIAGVQMASGPSVSANLNEAKRLIGMAVDQGAALVALPEWFACMGLKDTDKVRIREKAGDGPIQKFLADTARRNRIWLIGCSVPLESNDDARVFNSLLVYDDAGNRSRATTRSTCSVWTSRRRNSPKSAPSSRESRSRRSTRRSGGSDCQSATTCASPSFTGR
jgi:hypothetical protein